jgi:two-component sensor histidine kinase
MLQKKQNIFIHILGCFIFLSLPILFSPELNHHYTIINLLTSQSIHRPMISTTLLLAFFYANYYYFIPKFYVTEKYTFFTILIIISFIVFLLLPDIFIEEKRIDTLFQNNLPHRPPGKMPYSLLVNYNLFRFIGVFAFSLLLKVRERLKKTEIEKTNAELSYLKAQINPHFLFNTLNSIYSLAILKSDKTADAVVKLSEMMRYVLNDSNSNFISLKNELNYITNYIDLQRMRLTPNVKLNYAHEGIVLDKKIAPLILIPFIENAFKHGVNSEENSEIDIAIIVSETTIKLSVKNNCVSTNNQTLNKSGLGIENTKQRLNLLYPKNHLLNIAEVDNSFVVSLIINLHD